MEQEWSMCGPVSFSYLLGIGHLWEPSFGPTQMETQVLPRKGVLKLCSLLWLRRLIPPTIQCENSPHQQLHHCQMTLWCPSTRLSLIQGHMSCLEKTRLSNSKPKGKQMVGWALSQQGMWLWASFATVPTVGRVVGQGPLTNGGETDTSETLRKGEAYRTENDFIKETAGVRWHWKVSVL